MSDTGRDSRAETEQMQGKDAIIASQYTLIRHKIELRIRIRISFLFGAREVRYTSYNVQGTLILRMITPIWKISVQGLVRFIIFVESDIC